MLRALRLLFAAVLIPVPGASQPKAVEVFGQAGRVRLGADEGSLGGATFYGGALMVPFSERFGLDVDVQTGRKNSSVAPPHFLEIRRTLFSPSIVYRRRLGERVYGFAGGGIGGQFDRTRFTLTRFETDPPRIIGIEERTDSSSGWTLHGKAGVVTSLTPRFLVRAELFLAFRYVLPSVGVRIGAGYRF